MIVGNLTFIEEATEPLLYDDEPEHFLFFPSNLTATNLLQVMKTRTPQRALTPPIFTSTKAS